MYTPWTKTKQVFQFQFFLDVFLQKKETGKSPASMRISFHLLLFGKSFSLHEKRLLFVLK